MASFVIYPKYLTASSGGGRLALFGSGITSGPVIDPSTNTDSQAEAAGLSRIVTPIDRWLVGHGIVSATPGTPVASEVEAAQEADRIARVNQRIAMERARRAAQLARGGRLMRSRYQSPGSMDP